MPLTRYTSQIEVEVSDRIVNDTIIKQKARYVNLNHTQDGTVSIVTITVVVTLYANSNGEYGEDLTGAGITPYNEVLIADNRTLVNAKTGEILKIRKDESNAEWQEFAESQIENVMFQGDFFLMLRDTQSVIIGEMIKHHIQQANLIGKFN